MEEKYLNALEKIMNSRYSSRMYHIGGYQEASVCIQKDIDNQWVVYNGERGNRYSEIKCDTILKACLEFMRKFSHKVEDISAMETEFITLLN